MKKKITAIAGMTLVFIVTIFCQSCTDAKCLVEKQKCRFDCPSTVGVKQACEQKCNFMYDLCRSKK